MSFASAEALNDVSWQAFERLIARLLIVEGFFGVRLVGETNDGGADIIASKNGKRWLFQTKRWAARVGNSTVDRTIEAMSTYRASLPAVVSLAGFDAAVLSRVAALHASGINLQLWSRLDIIRRGEALPEEAPIVRSGEAKHSRAYQQHAIHKIVDRLIKRDSNRALVVMATGLGKTYVAAEAIRRYRASSKASARVLALAHTNALVDQMERAFWPFLKASQTTLQWNGLERPSISKINSCNTVFGSIQSVIDAYQREEPIDPFDLILVDECHHGGSPSYQELFERVDAGREGGPFLLGLTATPWHKDEVSFEEAFGEAVVSVDILEGLNNGFLSNVDYRLYTDNINWEGLKKLHGDRFSPKAINRAFFLPQWDDGVAVELRRLFSETERPRAIVFCSTIEHAIQMRDRINALRFCSAAAIYSGNASGAPRLLPYDRSKLMCDFQDNVINCICTVDIFNEGIDVPDVNIIVFQRVTHSRRIFIQQLGRGLRLSPGKDKVIVMDFVSDIRRFAAGLELKDGVRGKAAASGATIKLPHEVSFRRVGGDDSATEGFLREWLLDVAAIEGAGENVNVLRYPPAPSA